MDGLTGIKPAFPRQPAFICQLPRFFYGENSEARVVFQPDFGCFTGTEEVHLPASVAMRPGLFARARDARHDNGEDGTGRAVIAPHFFTN